MSHVWSIGGDNNSGISCRGKASSTELLRLAQGVLGRPDGGDQSPAVGNPHCHIGMSMVGSSIAEIRRRRQ